MEKKLIDYLHYYVGQKVKWFVSDEDPRGEIRILDANLLAQHLKHSDETYIELYLKPTAEITREHARQFIEFTPDEFGDTIDWYIKRGYDVFGLIKAGLAKHKNDFYI